MLTIIKSIILIIIIFVLLLYFIIKTINPFEVNNLLLNYFNIKIKIKGSQNIKNYNKYPIIIMANHINGIDYSIIYKTIHELNKDKTIYAVTKHNVFGDKNDDNILSNILALFKDDLYKFLNFILYERGNKKSGEITKKRMLKVLSNNNSVILFPEGETNKSKILKQFKPGSFKLCSDNNIHILPITLEYNKNIGVDRTEPINIQKWHNIIATVHIHPIIYDKNPDVLLNKVYNSINK